MTGAHDAMHHLARELDLDPTQQRAIAEILAKHQPEVDATWHAMQPHMRATLDSTTQDIVSVLRTDQALKYRRMTERCNRPPNEVGARSSCNMAVRSRVSTSCATSASDRLGPTMFSAVTGAIALTTVVAGSAS